MERRACLRIEELGGLAVLFPRPPAAAGAVSVAPAPTASLLSIALHTVNPPIGELQSYGEARYAGYVRALVPCTSDCWAITLDDYGIAGARSTKAILFPESQQQTSETIRYFSVALAEEGKVLVSRAVEACSCD
jgi:hypothetical protein